MRCAPIGPGCAQAQVVTPEELRQRTAAFAGRVLLLAKPLLERPLARQAATQLIAAATSVAANYRAACRARSHAEFTAKLCIVLEEADEPQFWLEFMRDCGLAHSEELTTLISEAGELVAIFTAARRTAKLRN